MTAADREHAAQRLMAFLEAVGPFEAIWAMTTAHEALQTPGALEGGDYLGAVAQAFTEAAAEADELAAKVPPPSADAGQPVGPGNAPAGSKPPRGKKERADDGEQP